MIQCELDQSQVDPAQLGALPLSEDQACSAWDPLRGTTAAPLVKCLLLTWVKMFPNKTVLKSAFASRKSANQQDVVGHYLVAGLSKDIYIYFLFYNGMSKKVFVPNIFGLCCGKHVWMFLNTWVVLLCNAVFLCELVHCTDTVCIFLYRPIQNLDHDDKSVNVADVPLKKKKKNHCAAWVQIFQSDYAKCA